MTLLFIGIFIAQACLLIGYRKTSIVLTIGVLIASMGVFACYL